jgi:hypothetical protein
VHAAFLAADQMARAAQRIAQVVDNRARKSAPEGRIAVTVSH